MPNTNLFNRQRPAIKPPTKKALNAATEINPAVLASIEDLRPGQLFMINLKRLDREFFDHISAQGQGCFFNSLKMEAVMKEWAQHLIDKGMVRQERLQKAAEKVKHA